MFSPQSLWNAKPVNPQFGSYQIPDAAYDSYLGAGSLAVTGFNVASTDALVDVYGHPDNPSANILDQDAENYITKVTVRMPAGALPAVGSDGHMDLLNATENRIDSFWEAYVEGSSNPNPGRYHAKTYAWMPLNGLGFADPGHRFQGARAAGVPPIAGIIRNSEWDDGDTQWRHTLCCSLDFSGLAANPAFTFPATSSDSDAAGTNHGQVKEGDLLMLPSTFDVSSLTGRFVQKLARTLMTYGCRPVDRNSGTPVLWYVENGSHAVDTYEGSYPNAAIIASLKAVKNALRVVTNQDGWLDGSGSAFTPNHRLNLLSMRGPWFLFTGSAPGVFDTQKQRVVFPAGTFTQQVNGTGKNAPFNYQTIPVAGETYRLDVQGSGGAQMYFTVTNGSTALYAVGYAGNGFSTSFTWPAGGTQVWVTTQSGSTGGGEVGGTLVKTADAPAFATNGVFYLSLRFVAGIYSSGAGVNGITRLKTLFPRQDVPAIDLSTGYFTETWYRALQFIYEKKLGGDLAPTLPQVTISVVETQAATTAISGTQTNIVQAIEANAASTAASIEVQVAAGTPGATQIPAPVLTVPTYQPGPNQVVE